MTDLDVSEKKRALREQTMEKAGRLPESYTAMADRQICEAVIGTPEYQSARTVFCFVGRDSEIDTRPILDDALQSGKILCVPKCIARGVMEARRITGYDDLALAKFGLLEPASRCDIVLPRDIDFVVVPCVTCNLFCERLGFGGGYYDTYLSASGFFTCMICRHELLFDEIPMEGHDVVPNMLITEKQTVNSHDAGLTGVPSSTSLPGDVMTASPSASPSETSVNLSPSRPIRTG